MQVKGIIFEDFVNYKKPSMVIEFPKCSFKCDKECGLQVCQNSTLVNEPSIDIEIKDIVKRYINNPITEAIVCQGLEPLDSINDLIELLYTIRVEYHCNDDIVIYTGYNKNEGVAEVLSTIKYPNIIVKYGRFIPNQKPHYDKVLGVNLASDNQYAEVLNES